MNITITLTAAETLAAMENGSLSNFITSNREVTPTATLEETTAPVGQGIQEPALIPGGGLVETTPVTTMQQAQPMTDFQQAAEQHVAPVQQQQPMQQAPVGMPQGQVSQPVGMPVQQPTMQQAPTFQSGPNNQPVMPGPTNAPVPNQQGGHQQANGPQPGQPVLANPGPVNTVLNQAPAGGQPISLDELRMKVWEVSKQGKDVNALLNNFGAVKIEDLDPGRYSDFLAAAQNL